MSDNQPILLTRLLAGDTGAFEEFYEATRDGMMRYLRTKISSSKDVEEVSQDVYLAFLDSLPLFRGGSSLKTFLYAIARHEVADYWRKRYAKKAIKTVPFVEHVYREKLYSSTELAQDIERCYAKLKPIQVKVLRWKYEEGLSVREIAGRLDVTVRAAEAQLYRARQAFQLVYAEG